MHPSLRCCSARAHTPLIKFLGKRSYPNTPEARHPHPAAPSELKQHFSEFLAKMKSSESETDATAVYSQFWEAPPRFWKPKVRQLEEDEMNAIMSGGASSY
ncbi:hypothetical protein GALMADRAFT_54485 [Galerina marginata CBS 339.88]|uniref:Uncharacterized protein n=1 Tax=Galerina marginata (strain CBS 339.88) TaxID=685588 RepID=A0A067TWE4_GALM3|nr:hypothetical protein GALMADRAFT_54485 [Galerina marginata CBS 339.88]